MTYNKFILIVFFISLISSCSKKTDLEKVNDLNRCIVPQNKLEGFKKENFKYLFTSKQTYLTIQFPEEFTGPGLHGFEGYCFNKNLAINGKTVIWATTNIFDAPNACKQYGKSLPAKIPEFILSEASESVLLKKAYSFCDLYSNYGVLYLEEEKRLNSKYYVGEYYMNIDGEFKNSLIFYFTDKKYLKQIKEILSTIK